MNDWSGGTPGIRQRTRRPIVRVWSRRTLRAAAHSASGSTAAARLWRVTISGSGSQASRSIIARPYFPLSCAVS